MSYATAALRSDVRLGHSTDDVLSAIKSHYIRGTPTIRFHSSDYTRPEGPAHPLTSCGLVLILDFGCRSEDLPDEHRNLLTCVVALTTK
jgi:hypothetical protein